MGAMEYNGSSKTIAEIVRRLNQGGGSGGTYVIFHTTEEWQSLTKLV